jgi:hypothetical protein
LFSGSCGGSAYDPSLYIHDEDAKMIEVITSQGLEQRDICLRASTIGQVTSDKIISLEICGSETISQPNQEEIFKVYSRTS